MCEIHFNIEFYLKICDYIIKKMENTNDKRGKYMRKVGIGILIAAIVGGAAVVACQNTKTPNLSNKVVAVSPKTGDININNIKFVDTNIKETKDGQVFETKIKNDTSKKIVGVNYVYSIDGQVFEVNSDEILAQGETGSVIESKIGKKINNDKLSLIKAKISYLNSDNKVVSEQFVQTT